MLSPTNIPVGEAEVEEIWSSLEKLTSVDPDISFSIDQSISKSLMEKKGASGNSVQISHPVSNRDAICVQGNDSVGHYAAILDEGFEDSNVIRLLRSQW